MSEIRDPVHGYVKLDRMALALIDTPQMQRLRWIKQLGLANLVYPGANHTRFEHSLGVYHLSGLLSEHLGLDEDEKLKSRASALLHDIGHGPLSHATESVISSCLRCEHESIAEILKRDPIRDVLGEFGLLPRDIQDRISGKTSLSQVISGEIDVDRMDYLIRDAHYTGVAYGVIDHLRLIQKMRIYNGFLAIESGGIQAAASLLVSRLLMHPTVYYHHVCRISEAMVSSGVRHMIDDGKSPKEIRSLDDMELFSLMASEEDTPQRWSPGSNRESSSRGRCTLGQRALSLATSQARGGSGRRLQKRLELIHHTSWWTFPHFQNQLRAIFQFWQKERSGR
jgi:HD superfamily phosphohydrolase